MFIDQDEGLKERRRRILERLPTRWMTGYEDKLETPVRSWDTGSFPIICSDDFAPMETSAVLKQYMVNKLWYAALNNELVYDKYMHFFSVCTSSPMWNS